MSFTKTRDTHTQSLYTAPNPQLEIVNTIQRQVAGWVESGYEDASWLTQTLLSHWFAEPHLLHDGITFFQWHPHQRRAVETTIYLYEVLGLRRTEEYAALDNKTYKAQIAPWAKIGLQLATGSGKTKVISLLSTWAALHYLLDTETNRDTLHFGNTQFLLAPNLIVLERLLADFAGGAIYGNDPLLPAELRREWRIQVVTPDNVPAENLPDTVYLVLSNIHKLFDLGAEPATVPNMASGPPELSLFDPATPAKPTTLDTGKNRILAFAESITGNTLVFNDEAHHVHDESVHYRPVTAAVKKRADDTEDEGEGIAWNRVLSRLHKSGGLALQTDLSATLFEESSKSWFRHTVYDFPLQEAIARGIVKQPYLAKPELRYKTGPDESIPLIDESATDPFDRNTHLIQAGIAELKKEQTALDVAGIARKALMFVVCNTKTEAAIIAGRLSEWCDPDTNETPFAGQVIEIHIGKKEATNDKEWQKIRAEINAVDKPDSPYRIIVSVMMLKEGWDVRNIKVIVPLRPCNSRQLTEQILGRGLRRMFPPAWNADGEKIGGDIKEGLYVIKHESFAKIIGDIKDIIEDEPDDASRPASGGVLVELVADQAEREAHDLPITRIVGAYDTSDDWSAKIGANKMLPLPRRYSYVSDLREIEGIIKHETTTNSGKVSEDPLLYNVKTADYATIEAVITNYAKSIRTEGRMSDYDIPAIKGVVKRYIERCTFDLKGIPLNLDAAVDFDEETRRIVIHNICRPNLREEVISHVSRIIGEARSGRETQDISLDTIQAKDLSPFETNLSRYVYPNPQKSVHTLCSFDSSDELYLAQLLDQADDVAAWLWNDQKGVAYRMQYSFQGKTPYYYPDFLVRLTSGDMIIVESKGSMRERDRAKQARAARYAALLSESDTRRWQYVLLLNDASVGRHDLGWWKKQSRTRFSDLLQHVANAVTDGLFVHPAP